MKNIIERNINLNHNWQNANTVMPCTQPQSHGIVATNIVIRKRCID